MKNLSKLITIIVLTVSFLFIHGSSKAMRISAFAKIECTVIALDNMKIKINGIKFTKKNYNKHIIKGMIDDVISIDKLTYKNKKLEGTLKVGDRIIGNLGYDATEYHKPPNFSAIVTSSGNIN